MADLIERLKAIRERQTLTREGWENTLDEAITALCAKDEEIARLAADVVEFLGTTNDLRKAEQRAERLVALVKEMSEFLTMSKPPDLIKRINKELK